MILNLSGNEVKQQVMKVKPNLSASPVSFLSAFDKYNSEHLSSHPTIDQHSGDITPIHEVSGPVEGHPHSSSISSPLSGHTSSSPPSLPSHPTHWTREELELLETRGFVVKDQFCKDLDLSSLALEVNSMKASGMLSSASMTSSSSKLNSSSSSNSNGKDSATWNDPSIRGDLHLWLNSDEWRSSSPSSPLSSFSSSDQTTLEGATPISSRFPLLSALLSQMDDLRLDLNARCSFQSSKTQVRDLQSSLGTIMSS